MKYLCRISKTKVRGEGRGGGGFSLPDRADRHGYRSGWSHSMWHSRPDRAPQGRQSPTGRRPQATRTIQRRQHRSGPEQETPPTTTMMMMLMTMLNTMMMCPHSPRNWMKRWRLPQPMLLSSADAKLKLIWQRKKEMSQSCFLVNRNGNLSYNSAGECHVPHAVKYAARYVVKSLRLL